ncbi:MAG: cytochrome c [Terricaulis sp.]
MKIVTAFATLMLLAACASSPQASNSEQRAIAHGRELARTNCSTCHAVMETGDSPMPEAPPFRTLSHNYRVDTLAEALAEGISVGHPAMPQFQFAPTDVDDLISYLQSIQDNRTAGPGALHPLPTQN